MLGIIILLLPASPQNVAFAAAGVEQLIQQVSLTLDRSLLFLLLSIHKAYWKRKNAELLHTASQLIAYGVAITIDIEICCWHISIRKVGNAR